MSSTVIGQSEADRADAVVRVHGVSLREARFGFVWSLVLVVLLLAIHPDWKTFGIWSVVAVSGAVFALVRAVAELRRQLDAVEQLPSSAVEAARRRRKKLIRKPAAWAGGLAGAIFAEIGSVLSEHHWLSRLAALAVAFVSTQMFSAPWP